MPTLLFDSNDGEVEAARRGIELHQREIASLDVKLASLLGEVESITKLKEEHQRQLRRHESTLTLARRLPPELLGHIFQHCVYVYPFAPLVLSQVCASWRSAAHGTPGIWSVLFIDCLRPWSVERTAHWISMSGSHIPLHIDLYPHDISLGAVMRILIPHAPRWKTLNIDASHPSYVQGVLEIIQAEECKLSVLDTLQLTFAESNQPLDIRRTFADRQCPRLRTIRLRSELLSLVHLPSHITTLSLVSLNPCLSTRTHLQIIQQLRNLPELQSFYLDLPEECYPHGPPSSAGDAILVMQDLQTVILKGEYFTYGILAHLTLPSLRHLGLRELDRASGTPAIGSTFLEMVARSSPPIKILELHGTQLTDDDLIRCFIYLPTLEELILHDSDISDEVFHYLCSPTINGDTPGSWICPQLKRLDLRWCWRLSGRVLTELVSSRLISSETCSITEVVVICCPSVHDDDVLSLAAMTVCRLKNRTEDFCCKHIIPALSLDAVILIS